MKRNMGSPIDELNERIRQNSLGISRVPPDTKKEFIELANAKFIGDYGMTLKWCLDQAIEYQQMKFSLFNGLLSQTEQVPVLQDEEKPSDIRTLGGKRIEIKRREINHGE